MLRLIAELELFHALHKPKGERGASIQILTPRREMERQDIEFVLHLRVLTIFHVRYDTKDTVIR
jgi:hypothetical protein